MFRGGPNISKYMDPWETNNFRGVHLFQLTCEIFVPGGPNISKYKDRGNHFGGVQIYHDRPTSRDECGWGGAAALPGSSLASQTQPTPARIAFSITHTESNPRWG